MLLTNDDLAFMLALLLAPSLKLANLVLIYNPLCSVELSTNKRSTFTLPMPVIAASAYGIIPTPFSRTRNPEDLTMFISILGNDRP